MSVFVTPWIFPFFLPLIVGPRARQIREATCAISETVGSKSGCYAMLHGAAVEHYGAQVIAGSPNPPPESGIFSVIGAKRDKQARC